MKRSMKRIMKRILILVIGCGLVFGALNYHFILTDKTIKILKKSDLTFNDTFVDARGVKKIKLYLNPALVKAGVGDLFKDAGK